MTAIPQGPVCALTTKQNWVSGSSTYWRKRTTYHTHESCGTKISAAIGAFRLTVDTAVDVPPAQRKPMRRLGKR